MAAHFSILVWRLLWTEEPRGLWSIGSQRVGHGGSSLALAPQTHRGPLWEGTAYGCDSPETEMMASTLRCYQHHRWDSGHHRVGGCQRRHVPSGTQESSHHWSTPPGTAVRKSKEKSLPRRSHVAVGSCGIIFTVRDRPCQGPERQGALASSQRWWVS